MSFRSRTLEVVRRRWAAAPAPSRPCHDVAGFAEAVLEAFEGDEVTLCLADETDLIRYASASFRRVFCPHYDGAPADFMSVIDVAIRAGTGIKLVSAPPADFARRISERRRRQVGSYSFATDTADGNWWWVTDVKLANGWMLCTAQNITALKHQEFRLRDAHAAVLEEVQTDHLTGIASRRYGLKRAEALFEAARSTGDPISVALFDLDHFKGINDRHGHEAGDRALAHLARHVLRETGAGDRFSRLGGDEFLFVVEGDLVALRRSLVGALETLPPLDLGGECAIRLSVSVGLAAMTASDARWADLMRRADQALYDAKAGGRCRVACAA